MTYPPPGDPSYPQQPYPQYPQQPPGYPGGYGPPPPQSNGLAVAGLVCGLVGLLIFNIILGPLALIFGGIGYSRAKAGAPNRGMSLAAIILGVCDLIIFVAVLIWVENHGGFVV